MTVGEFKKLLEKFDDSVEIRVPMVKHDVYYDEFYSVEAYDLDDCGSIVYSDEEDSDDRIVDRNVICLG